MLTIDWVGGECPVQAEGTYRGRFFYFRARGNQWSFTIDDPEWKYSEFYGDAPFEAGYMSEEEALRMIDKAIKILEEENA